MNPKRLIALMAAILMLFSVLPVFALEARTEEEDYYSDNGYPAETLLSMSGSELEYALNELMTTTHTHITTYNELKDLFYGTDADPDVPGNILLIYTGESVNGAWDSGVTYNREHVWPRSLGKDVIDTTWGGDMYHIRPASASENTARSNYPMAWVDTANKEMTVNGASTGSYINTSTKLFEPRDEEKGDVARIYFYLATRWGLDLTSPVDDDTFATLLEWNILDPVSDFELARSEYAQSVQGNRNVYADYPELARLVYGSAANGFDYTPVESGDYTYYLENGSAVIISYNGSASDVEIPSAIDGHLVTAIGCAAFANNSALTSVTIPASVASVGTYAFYNDANLASVFVQGAVTFERRAFRTCPQLTGLYFSGAAPVFLNEGEDQIMVSGEDDGAVPQGFKLYYVQGASGWSGSTWSSGTTTYQTAVWDGTEVPAAPVVFTVGTVTGAHAGDTVTVPVTVSGEYEAHTLNGTFVYDSANLTLDSISAGSLLPADAILLPNGDSFGIMVPATSITGSGTVLELTFTVAETCTADQPVSLNVTQFQYMPLGQSAGTEINFVTVDGAVCMAQPEPTPTPTPEPGEGGYVLVTDIEDVTDGDYVIYGVNGNYKGAMTSSVNKGHMLATSVTLNGDRVVDPDASAIWHFAQQSDGSFTIYNASAGVYCMISGDSTGGFTVDTTATYGYNITAGEGNTFYMQTTLPGCTRMISIYQNDFRPYNTANWHDLYLYKYVEGDTPDPTPEPTVEPTQIPYPVYYTVTFLDWDGSPISEQYVREHEDAVAPADPIREGYTFTGWDVDFTDVTSDLTVTAQYSINAYTLTINYVDAAGEALAPTYTGTFNYGEAYSIMSPDVEGYTTAQTAVSGNMPASDVTVTVTYTQNAVPAGLPGDVNCDGHVTMADLSALSAYMLGKAQLTAEGLANADVNGDGSVNAMDLPLIYQLTLAV